MDLPVSNFLSDVRGYDELKLMNSPVMLSQNNKPDLSTQVVVEQKHAKEDLSVFFGIGMAVNIVMIVAFIVWARKEWKKHEVTKK